MAHFKDVVYSPACGQTRSLDAKSDMAFVGNDSGEGLAIVLTEGKIKAPFDGVVVKQNNHAIVLKNKNGMLVQISFLCESEIPTDIFMVCPKDHQEFVKGDLLYLFDLKKYKEHTGNTDIALNIINHQKYLGIIPMAIGKTDFGDVLITTIVSEAL